jgi:transposase
MRACETSTATQQQIAERFSVSTAWIGKLRRQLRKTGSLAFQAAMALGRVGQVVQFRF